MPCSPAMTFWSIVGHARRHTAGPIGPSTIERSNFCLGCCATSAISFTLAFTGIVVDPSGSPRCPEFRRLCGTCRLHPYSGPARTPSIVSFLLRTDQRHVEHFDFHVAPGVALPNRNALACGPFHRVKTRMLNA